MICPLMQEHFLRPLLKRKSLPLRLNKSFRLFILLQSASWIWIAKGDILLLLNVMVSFNFCHAGPSSFNIFCSMLNFHRKWFTDPNFEEWVIGTHFVEGDFLSKKNSDPSIDRVLASQLHFSYSVLVWMIQWIILSSPSWLTGGTPKFKKWREIF